MKSREEKLSSTERLIDLLEECGVGIIEPVGISPSAAGSRTRTDLSPVWLSRLKATAPQPRKGSHRVMGESTANSAQLV
jgi:hypothetical protein